MKNSKRLNQSTLELFGCVVTRDGERGNVEVLLKDGVVISEKAAPQKVDILNYIKDLKSSGENLNKTFQKSWKDIMDKSGEELTFESMKHYLSKSISDIITQPTWSPESTLEIPILKSVNTEVTFKIIEGVSRELMIGKILHLLNSGIALSATFLVSMFIILEEIDFDLSIEELQDVSNKEAKMYFMDKFNIIPTQPEEFLRYIIYKSTGTTLLIQSTDLLNEISGQNKDTSDLLLQFGEANLAPIFNRYKRLFLAIKNDRNSTIINRISRLSKRLHKPMVRNPLNNVTNKELLKSDIPWLENATIFSLFKALSALFNRINGQNTFLYKIRNGKSFVRTLDIQEDICKKNFNIILTFMKENYSLKGKSFYEPEFISYALPTSEKMFVGEFPFGTKFIAKNICVGIYWENSWGANDLDLSGLNIAGKIGWNASQKQHGGESLMYSGDLTDARDGAMEYLYANDGLLYPTLVQNNVYEGSSTTKYKIVIGGGSDVSMKYMMDPNKVISEVFCESVQKSTILGILLPEGSGKQSFTLLNLGSGNSKISGDSDVSRMATRAMYQEFRTPLTMRSIFESLGATFVTDISQGAENIINLSPNKLTKEFLISVLLDIEKVIIT